MTIAFGNMTPTEMTIMIAERISKMLATANPVAKTNPFTRRNSPNSMINPERSSR